MTWPCLLIGHKLTLVSSEIDQVGFCLRCGLVVGVFDDRWRRDDPEPEAKPVRPTALPDEPPRPLMPEAKSRPPV